MWTKDNKFSVEIFFTAKFSYMLEELEQLGEGSLLDDALRCKYFLLKGLQRFLLFCCEKNLDFDQALLDLTVQGSSFASDLPYSNLKCSDLYERLINGNYSASENVLQSTISQPKTTQDLGINHNASQVEVKPKNSELSLEERNDDEDWSAFAPAMGMTMDEK
jgi:hypothetical protein